MFHYPTGPKAANRHVCVRLTPVENEAGVSLSQWEAHTHGHIHTPLDTQSIVLTTVRRG